MLERTLSIIKPDACRAGHMGEIISRFEREGLRIVAMRLLRLTRPQAEGFYAVHRERPFFADLVEFMTSGPVVVMVLEGENAIERNRRIMGATDPAQAAEGTLRKLFASNIQNNAVHGSDGPDTARTEVAYFFSTLDQVDWD
ncbi:MAG: nucleoside-diphosphate kinase [Deltaproteobacteria bacterium]|nr:MAG: nucleoside-diphosphate kinase [Deltaproteobacteria bacterium]